MRAAGFIIAVLIFIAGGSVDSSVRSQTSSPRPSHSKPNFILILAEDLGYGDLGCYGGSKIQTPNIDGLARNGVRFTDYHAASSLGPVSRGSLLTGLFMSQLGVEWEFGAAAKKTLPREAITLPELLRPQGYTTIHIGKWGLGGLRRGDLGDRNQGAPGPLQHGFDHYLSMIEETDFSDRPPGPRRLYHEGGKSLLQDDRLASARFEHLTDIQVSEAEQWIENVSAQGHPFFINLWFDAPSVPYEPAPNQSLAPYQVSATGDDLMYRSMVSHLDAAVGRIVNSLKLRGLAENTWIIFTSSNGPTGPGSSTPFRGGKGTLLEGGIRVPLIIVSPDRRRAGAVSTEFTISADIAPTLAEASGVTYSQGIPTDGLSLLDVLHGGRKLLRRDPVFWRTEEHALLQAQYGEKPPFANEAIRWGKWKLLARDGHAIGLYSLENDPSEQKNLMNEQWKVRDQMLRRLRAWLTTTRMWTERARLFTMRY
jgi:arylsulfatase A